METRFVVKVTATANKDNKNFAGDVHTYIYGKDQELLKMAGTGDHDIDNMTSYFIKEYGYKRLCDAKRSYIYTSRNDEEQFWDKEVGIIEVTC